MIGRLVYEVRLLKTETQPRASRGRPWRWDVTYYKTTDPEYPGVDSGREHLGGICGYERYRWQALRRIGSNIQNNAYQKKYKEHLYKMGADS